MKNLKSIKTKHSGRDAGGRVSVRHQGGEQKRFLREIDFKRDKRNIKGTVIGIEYDPNRTVDIALIQYQDSERRYILAPEGLKLKDNIIASETADVKTGNAMKLLSMPIGTFVHNVELTPGHGGQMARSAGTFAVVAAREGKVVHLKLPSGEVRKILADSFATVGVLGNQDLKNRFFKKAGTKRHMGIRPSVRGVAQNPRSHPHGGGEG
ncbi:MAG: 50S ribosomal protein L2, partial [Candidatus Levybacteria bacterium]|nr:50S ribosomal protein L2 [Candidatus Levybacteria bacterium]